jgi:hypothetical protein
LDSNNNYKLEGVNYFMSVIEAFGKVGNGNYYKGVIAFKNEILGRCSSRAIKTLDDVAKALVDTGIVPCDGDKKKAIRDAKMFVFELEGRDWNFSDRKHLRITRYGQGIEHYEVRVYKI